MTTPWDKINVDGFRAYLTTVGYTADEFNAHPNRAALFNSFAEYRRQEPQQQQQQQTVATNEIFLQQIKGVVEDVLKDNDTREVRMSEANRDDANTVLAANNISWTVDPLNEDTGVGSPVENYQWEEDLLNGGKAKISEPDGTKKALKWLFGKFKQDCGLGIRDVKGTTLPIVKGGGVLVKGRSDGCIAKESMLKTCEDTGVSLFTYGMALVELKTDRNVMNFAQMVLQLVALSLASTWKRAVVLLGTDGNRKWFLVHFTAFTKMAVSQYTNGRQCLNDFESLLTSMDSRKAELEAEVTQHAKRAKLAPVLEGGHLEAEQDLGGFFPPLRDTDGAGESQEAVDRAIENEAFLHRLANALAESPLSDGVRPSVPEWALARNVVPSYYM
mmetsp:Transcript_8054/g.16999  ORF Transcript_8054/g.16999 Transcript_8054/m.16999 type:complete len:387 (+) Transcript_8054:495-1655(+)